MFSVPEMELVPYAFTAKTVMRCDPLRSLVAVPVIIPVFGSIANPAGKLPLKVAVRPSRGTVKLKPSPTVPESVRLDGRSGTSPTNIVTVPVPDPFAFVALIVTA